MQQFKQMKLKIFPMKAEDLFKVLREDLHKICQQNSAHQIFICKFRLKL